MAENYIIVELSSGEISNIEHHSVNEKIAEGYIPVGSPFVAGIRQLYQAMVKKEITMAGGSRMARRTRKNRK